MLTVISVLLLLLLAIGSALFLFLRWLTDRFSWSTTDELPHLVIPDEDEDED